MQQQICQPEQMGQQQQPQQVMLCPVRLVYETQILVQPGEQIHPNQTLFINPQNPPPWIQNRPQNQVIYMQQLPNNMVPSVPQHIDQNQMYLQNLQSYYPQQMIQVDQMRQMQNIVQMVPNMNSINQLTTQNINNMGQSVINVSQNVSNIAPNVNLNAGQNVMPMTNVVQNVNQKPANVGVNIAQNITNDPRMYNPSANAMPNTIQMTNQQNTMQNITQTQERPVNMNQNLVNMQKVAEMQGIRQQNVRQPQVTVSPMQNVKYAQNVGDVRPIATPNVVDNRTVNSPRPMTNVNTINNIPNNVVQANALNRKVPLPNKPNSNVMTNQVRHYNQTYYRPIQPRPMSVMPMVQNQYAPIGTQTLNVPRPNQIVNEVNRKRKSESPDETRKKIPNINNQPVTTIPNVGNYSMSVVPNMPNKMVNVVSDMGVNTSPVHAKPVRTVEMASTGTQANIVREKSQNNEMKAVPPILKDNVPVEGDKLVRNTVFTQARGLLRTEPQIMQPDIISIHKIENVVPPNVTPGDEKITLGTVVNPVDPTFDKMNPVNSTFEKKYPLNPTVEKNHHFNPTIENVNTVNPIVEKNNPVNPTVEKMHQINPVNPTAERMNPANTTVEKMNPVNPTVQKMNPVNPTVQKMNPVNPTVQKMNPINPTVEKMIQETKIKVEVPLKLETPKQIPEIVKIESSSSSTSTESKPKQIIKQEVKLKKEDNTKRDVEENPAPDVKFKTPEVTKTEVIETKPVKTEAKEDKEVSKKFTVTAISDFKGNEIQIADGSVRKEDTDSYILTHVLDGYVIQESNTAFPIRRPLKEKTIYQNTDLTLDQKKEETPYKHRTEDGRLIKDNSKILTISDLNLNEDEKKEESEEKCDEEHPFANVTPSTIKSWTVDQLAAHLSKYNWSETISVLSEHEIDGESLFLVSRQQLVQIGVNEAHADAICEFIKST